MLTICIDAADESEALRKLAAAVLDPSDWFAQYSEPGGGTRGRTRFYFATDDATMPPMAPPATRVVELQDEWPMIFEDTAATIAATAAAATPITYPRRSRDEAQDAED